MSQILLSNRLKASKAPRLRIWVPNLKDISPWVNIWKPALKNHGLKSWLKLKFWTWSVTQNINPSETLFYAKKNTKFWENYANANKKLCKHNLKNMYIYRFCKLLEKNTWSKKKSIVANNYKIWNRHRKKIWVGTAWCQIWNQNQKNFEIFHSVTYYFVEFCQIVPKS